jgi:hypothetical protein
MSLNTDLVEVAVALGHQDALGSYPTEQAVFTAVKSACPRPVVVSDRLVSALADVYDEAREEKHAEPEIEAL